MDCYGQKEDWYTLISPKGTVPAVQIDGANVTDSADAILESLEKAFGPLNGTSMIDEEVVHVRGLEKQLREAW